MGAREWTAMQLLGVFCIAFFIESVLVSPLESWVTQTNQQNICPCKFLNIIAIIIINLKNCMAIDVCDAYNKRTLQLFKTKLSDAHKYFIKLLNQHWNKINCEKTYFFIKDNKVFWAIYQWLRFTYTMVYL